MYVYSIRSSLWFKIVRKNLFPFFTNKDLLVLTWSICKITLADNCNWKNKSCGENKPKPCGLLSWCCVMHIGQLWEESSVRTVCNEIKKKQKKKKKDAQFHVISTPTDLCSECFFLDFCRLFLAPHTHTCICSSELVMKSTVCKTTNSTLSVTCFH